MTGRRFQDAVVLITGAARGIGAQVARRFATEGAVVAVLDRDADGCDQVVGDIVDGGGRAFGVTADLADHVQRAGVVDEVLARGRRLDVLVNNAAVLGPRQPLVELTEEDVREVIEVNLMTPLLLSRDAVPHLERRRGAIVTLGSIQASAPLATFVPYAATKGALAAMTRALAVEVAPAGIRVNAVAPGAVESPAMREQWEATTGSSGAPPAPTLVGRWGTGQDIAEVVLFLSSFAADYISGEVVRVDGGRLLSRSPDPLVSDRR